MHSPYDRYQKIAVETADALELVLMLYRGALSDLGKAAQDLEGGQFAAAHQRLLHAQEIVAELMGGVNLDAGDIAGQLWQVYDYIQRRLIHANIRKDVAAVVEARGLLSELYVAWQQAREQRAGAARAFAAAVA